METCSFIRWICPMLHIHRPVWQDMHVLHVAECVCINIRGKLYQWDPPYENGSWINGTEIKS